MTNEHRIIEALRRFGELDDDELSAATGVKPRQQVNQICRLLEARGRLLRGIGSRGKIVNVLLDVKTFEQPAQETSRTIARNAEPRSPLHSTKIESHGNLPGAFDCDTGKTLFIFPCSGSKDPVSGTRTPGPSILDDLSPSLSLRLTKAREAVRFRAHVDESSLLPAWRRYTGSLYQTARDAIGEALAAGVHMIIVSGGYGLVLAAEPIGLYEAVFKMSWWPGRVLEDTTAEYMLRNQLRAVRAIASATTGYAKLLRRVDWHAARVEDGWLLTPEEAAGAMFNSPRTQGEALVNLLHGRLHRDWVSSVGLRLHANWLAS